MMTRIASAHRIGSLGVPWTNSERLLEKEPQIPKIITKSSVDGWLDAMETDSVDLPDGKFLRAIGAALESREAAARQLDEAVSAARAAGESWQAIGVILGTSKQAAHRKFAR